MDDDVIIRANNISMEFNLSQEKTDNLKEYFIKVIKRELRFQSFWALQDISFEINRGDKIGFIGLNGAGKSTLLKIISGVMKPTRGSMEINGGAGFDEELTARENIFLNGAILGHSKAFMEDKFDEIVEFSEIGDFIDVPVKNYSSGMKSRLAFSIASSVNPEILILDEVLSVGDISFQKKCKKRMSNMMQDDVTLLFVSHSIAQVRDLCDKAVWLNQGQLMSKGEVNTVCNEFIDYVQKNKLL